MINVYEILSENLIKLRKSKDLTQAELADILKFSDKSISKWETGMSYPSIDTLAEIAEFYNISLDDLCLRLIEEEKANQFGKETNTKKALIQILSVVVIFFIATIIFVYSCMRKDIAPAWQTFVWAVPISTLITMLLDLKWRGRKNLFIYSSIFVWSLIAAIYCQYIHTNLFLLFIVGAPLQIIILLVKSIKSESFINKVDNIGKKSKNNTKEKSK